MAGLHMWQGGLHGRGCAWWEHAWQGGVWQVGHAWQERRPLQQMVRILLECILAFACSMIFFAAASVDVNRPFR